MREIKFRAVYKTDPACLLFYQQIVNDVELWFVAETDPELRYRFEVVMVDDDWLKEQFTGLKDKNGKEIYEGDIICDQCNNIGAVVFATVGVGSCGCCYVKFEGFGFIVDGASINYKCSIIGNIHENPELLK